jgi:3-isopropylmalate/(R)-2-methylmalate dehydratase large subunit
VHVVGPEQGIILPGMTVVCGDSHTSTHGALAALAFGIGTSEVEHVLATQTLIQKKSKNLRINVNGKLPIGVTAKDVILKIIGTIGTAGGSGYVIEFAGEVIRNLSIEERMTICNMTIEAGARAGLIAPDQITFDYIKGRPYAPNAENWDKAIEFWKSLPSDENANYDKEININAEEITPQITWGTSPQDVAPINGKVPNPEKIDDVNRKKAVERSLEYMGLEPYQFLFFQFLDQALNPCILKNVQQLFFY